MRASGAWQTHQMGLLMKRKGVFVLGPEGSGSKLVARIVAHILEVDSFESWGGGGCVDRGGHKVCHRSIPYGTASRMPDVNAWVADHEEDYELLLIIAIRDRTLSENSRLERFSKPYRRVQQESEEARALLAEVLEGEQRCFIWSYETFMFLGATYLKRLYTFLGVSSDFMPVLVDGNKKRLQRGGLDKILRLQAGLLRRLRRIGR